MKTILITGSTDGIGQLLAFQLAQEKHQILVHGRSLEKVNATISAIKSQTNHSEISGYVADFTNLEEVEKMANRIASKHSIIDVLVNNAGIFNTSIEINAEGIDVRFLVNFLAPKLLTEKLKIPLSKADQPRIINLSSAAQSSVSVKGLRGEENLSAQEAYAQSKLALTMWSFDLAQKWDFATVIAVNPGSLLNTKMAHEVYGQYWSPAEKGVDILYELAISAKHAAHSGAYFDNDNGAYAAAHPDAYNPQLIDSVLEGSRILYHL